MRLCSASEVRHVDTLSHLDMCVHVRVRVCMCVHACVCVRVCLYVSKIVCMCLRACMHMWHAYGTQGGWNSGCSPYLTFLARPQHQTDQAKPYY